MDLIKAYKYLEMEDSHETEYKNEKKSWRKKTWGDWDQSCT